MAALGQNNFGYKKLIWSWIGVYVASRLLAEVVYELLGGIYFFTRWGFLPIIISALVVALGQWLYLRRFFQKIGWWIPATVVGLSVLNLIAEIQLIAGEYGMAPIFLVGIFVGWIMIGTLQWLVLRPHLRRAGWWILGSTVGLFLTSIIGFLASALAYAVLFGMSQSDVVTLNSSTTTSNLIFYGIYLSGSALAYGMYGLATGYVLHRLMKTNSRIEEGEADLNS